MGAKRRKSRKQSITSERYQKQLKQVTFYLERSLGGRIILEELRKAGLRVEPHFKWFRADTIDELWLPEVGRKKWVVLMRDLKIGKRRLEKDALINGGVKAFALVSGEMKNAENAAIIIKAMPRILDTITKNNFPFIAKVHRHGTVKLWFFKAKGRKGSRRKIKKK